MESYKKSLILFLVLTNLYQCPIQVGDEVVRVYVQMNLNNLYFPKKSAFLEYIRGLYPGMTLVSCNPIHASQNGASYKLIPIEQLVCGILDRDAARCGWSNWNRYIGPRVFYEITNVFAEIRDQNLRMGPYAAATLPSVRTLAQRLIDMPGQTCRGIVLCLGHHIAFPYYNTPQGRWADQVLNTIWKSIHQIHVQQLEAKLREIERKTAELDEQISEACKEPNAVAGPLTYFVLHNARVSLVQEKHICECQITKFNPWQPIKFSHEDLLDEFPGSNPRDRSDLTWEHYATLTTFEVMDTIRRLSPWTAAQPLVIEGQLYHWNQLVCKVGDTLYVR